MVSDIGNVRQSIRDALSRLPRANENVFPIESTDTGISAGDGYLQLSRMESGLRAFFPIKSSIGNAPAHAGLSLSEINLKSNKAESPTTCLAIDCLNPILEETFVDLISVLAAKFISDPENASLITRSEYLRWHELFSDPPRDVSDDKAIGLLGEMIALSAIVKKLGPNSISSWRGPKGRNQDFIVGNHALEVKTTRSNHIDRLTINGVNQLADTEASSIHLAVFRLDEREGGRSIRGEFEFLTERGVDPLELRSLMKPVTLPESPSAQKQWELIEECVFEVDRAFPKIVPSSFQGGNVPENVSIANYQISVGGISPISKKEVVNTWLENIEAL